MDDAAGDVAAHGDGVLKRFTCSCTRPESQIGLYKSELIHLEGPWRDVAHVEAATAEWVSWFNNERMHGSLDDLTPLEIEQIDYARHQPLETAA